MTDRMARNFEQLVLWGILAAVGSALVFLGIGLAVGDQGTIYSAAVVGLYVVALLFARGLLRRRDFIRTLFLISAGLVCIVVVLTVLQPLLWMNYALVPLLAAAVILQFAPRMRIAPALVACGAATTVIAIIGELLSPLGLRPDPAIQLLRVFSLSTTIGFLLFLLWQVRIRLYESIDETQATNAELAGRNEHLAEANQRLEREMALSAQLVEQVSALETPVTTLADGVLFAPFVGQLTARRSTDMRERLLERVYRSRARWILIDLQGVPQMDTQVATELGATCQAIRLLGCDVCLCGITATVATVLAQLGVSFGDILTARSPQEAVLLIGVTADGPSSGAVK